MKKILVTGSGGLIGSEVAEHYCRKQWQVFGIDNNMRADFFGPAGDTSWNQERLSRMYPRFSRIDLDIRNRALVLEILKKIRPEAIVHAAAQPSHDLAARRVFDDFDVNAGGTLNLLESARIACPETIFVHLSTNKVYGDGPNRLRMIETPTRWDYADKEFYEGIKEDFGTDQSKHSLMGASKTAADIYVQEYGRYFNMYTCCLRGGCLTGPAHSGVELHGFLSYLVKCNVEGKKYTVFGYKGKQVRDNIHSADVVSFIDRFIDKPRIAEVYNIGGGRGNSVSVLEAFSLAESVSGKVMVYEYSPRNREGDHICYISDLGKIKSHFAGWKITRTLPVIFEELFRSWIQRNKA